MNNIYLERVSKNALVPTKGTTHAACYDLYADMSQRKVTVRDELNEEFHVLVVQGNDFILEAGERALIPTGWKMQCPVGTSIDFLPRSGQAWKRGLTVINSPGVIDHDYQNECFVAVVNTTQEAIKIVHGERIAQMRLVPVLETKLIEAELPPVSSDRTGGFGSTGV